MNFVTRKQEKSKLFLNLPAPCHKLSPSLVQFLPDYQTQNLPLHFFRFLNTYEKKIIMGNLKQRITNVIVWSHKVEEYNSITDKVIDKFAPEFEKETGQGASYLNRLFTFSAHLINGFKNNSMISTGSRIEAGLFTFTEEKIRPFFEKLLKEHEFQFVTIEIDIDNRTSKIISSGDGLPI